MTTRLLTLEEAASRLNLPPATLRFWRTRRTGPPSALIGRHVMYRDADLELWIAQQFDAATQR